ncbi:MAG TPA: acylphosphatase [Patescibacteria group bacterium]|nr:acylphosphatase [Patescibacteria group bacterium]
MKDAYVVVSGFVQGVGYRKFAKKVAAAIGLTGWVRNVPDGTVEALLQGEEHIIKKAITSLKKGPFLAEIEHVDVMWSDQKEKLLDFVIRRDS